MSASVIFRWEGPDKEHFQGEGVIRDMSVSGVYVLTTTCPPVNATVYTEVFHSPSDGAPKARMNASMRVLRVEHEIAGDKRSGFSAVGKGFALRATAKQASGPIRDSAEKLEDPK